MDEPTGITLQTLRDIGKKTYGTLRFSVTVMDEGSGYVFLNLVVPLGSDPRHTYQVWDQVGYGDDIGSAMQKLILNAAAEIKKNKENHPERWTT